MNVSVCAACIWLLRRMEYMYSVFCHGWFVPVDLCVTCAVVFSWCY